VVRFPQYASVDGDEGGEIDMASLGNRGDQPDGIRDWAAKSRENAALKTLSISMYYVLYIYKSYVIYNIYDSMTLHMWYLYENHDDGSICILTTPSNSLYVAALLLRVFFRGSEDMRRQR
jgi:hypothetical protein